MSLLEWKADLQIFDGLKAYSRADVDLINLFADLFRADAHWQRWIQQGLGALLEVAGKRLVVLEQTNQMEPGETRKITLQKDEISIGREQDNDVVIPFPGVGRHHARITKREARYFIEDLGSANGTYLNDIRIEPHRSAPLNDGARLLIFPHQFTFSNNQLWRPEAPLRIASSAPRVITWSERQWREFPGTQLFSVKISPGIGSVVLRVSQDFLKALVFRVSHSEIDYIAPEDAGLFEFLLLSVLERASGDLRFPFHFSLIPFDSPPEGEEGISVECMIGLTGVTGAIEIFVPAKLLRQIQSSHRHREQLGIPVCWPVTVTSGYSDLTWQDLAKLEPGDILLAASAHKVLLPPSLQASEGGWRAALVHSDPMRLKIEDYFERSDLAMEAQPAFQVQSEFEKPNLAALPVRVHVVLSQLEMTFSELNQLRPGSIVELDRKKSDIVQLAVNGKIAGEGELVEIEGRLGVRIANWNTQ